MRQKKLFSLVDKAYRENNQEIGLWLWENHTQKVGEIAVSLAEKYKADKELVTVAAYLHDFGDAFVDRKSSQFEEINNKNTQQVLSEAGYSNSEIVEITKIISKHSCKDGNLPSSLEEKVLATADAISHLDLNLCLQFCWMKIPRNISFEEWLKWMNKKVDKEFEKKMFFEDEKEAIRANYEALKLLFKKKV